MRFHTDRLNRAVSPKPKPFNLLVYPQSGVAFAAGG